MSNVVTGPLGDQADTPSQTPHGKDEVVSAEPYQRKSRNLQEKL